MEWERSHPEENKPKHSQGRLAGNPRPDPDPVRPDAPADAFGGVAAGFTRPL